MAIKNLKLVGDFETTTQPEDVRVWASCLVNISEKADTVFIGNDIESFMEFLSDKNSTVYFHNLKFDGEFIFSYLLTHGFRYSEEPKNRTFSVLISGDGIFYSISVIFEKLKKKYKKVVFRDSLKKLPFKVAVIAKAFDLDDEKLEIDYRAYRPRGHQLTEEEEKYIVADCRIVAQALHIQFSQDLKKFTNASDAMTNYKKIVGKNFDRWFPVFPLELDTDIRRAYKGGFTYLKPQHKNRRGLAGKTYDVNSLYPWAMRSCLLPWGYPVYFEGDPPEDEKYPLFIVRLACSFKVKKDHIPTIQLKKNRAFVETEYLESSNGEIVEMTLTSVDLKLFLDHYDTDYLVYISGFKFKGQTGMFDEYIDHWMQVKEHNTGAIRQLAKLMLNSLYGRFAMNPESKKKIPYIDENGVIRYTIETEEPRDPVYTAMGCFITAYAREKTIRSAQAIYDRFIYADTDSLHIIGEEPPENLEIHPTHLGAWKDEGTFTDSLFIRQKTYMETVDGKTKVTCAGMPDNVKEQVTYDNFNADTVFTGKLRPVRYPGGIILEDTSFTIK